MVLTLQALFITFMRYTKKLTLLSCFVFTVLTQSFAQQIEKKVPPLRLLIGGALELGGDEVAKVYFTNGNTQSVNAGQGGSIAVGGEWMLPGTRNFAVRGTVGYKYVTTAADNVHIRLTRVPLIFTGNWMPAKKLRLAGGVAMHRNIRFKADGLGGDVTFEGASGPTFEVAYAGIGLTYTAMQYKDQAKEAYSANAIGLSFSLTIPNK